MINLSKSRILSGLQCPKRLFLEIHQPSLATESNSAEKAFDVGHQVTGMARTFYPGGKLIGFEDDSARAVSETDSLLSASGPDIVLFEPAFRHEGVFARPDILIVRNGRTQLKEVKSSARVKPHHVTDAAIQAWILRGLGYEVDSVTILYIDTGFVYQGNGCYDGLFHEEDITANVDALQPDIPQWLDGLRRIVVGDMPDIGIGAQCTSPFPCPFQTYCLTGAPEYPVSLLPRAGKLVKNLMAQGYRDLRDVPAQSLNNDRQRRILECTRSGTVFVSDEIAGQLNALPYPRYYLDFESVQFAIPIWAGTAPFEQLPFQWSCHIERANGSLEHEEFLGEPGEPPMRAFAESLITCLGENGPIMVYSGFEKTTLRQLQKRYPELTIALDDIIARLVDLLPIAEQHYYHPAMKGSWSIKAVLPTIAPELDYNSLSVKDGIMAQQAYLEMIDPAKTPERQLAIKQGLLEYCEQDTLAMVKLCKFLSETTNQERGSN